MHLLKKLTFVLTALFSCLSLSAQGQKQEDKDSLVVLLSSKSAQMVDVEGARYRKVVGPARFLHNNTYLICDTALWNVETQIIDAWGHVSIIQEETILTSDNLQYLINEDLAKFRGSMVQLTDKDHNTLRTRHLDYNTKDSLAVFMNGASMRDKDGQIIESRNGTYDSKIKKFTFEDDVNMFTDSVFVKTRELVYESDLNLATFGSATDAWQDDNMLSANRGWYDRGRELFFFENNVHVMTVDQEGWCDSLYFNKVSSDVEMLGNAQITDTTRNVFAIAGRLQYVDSTSKVTMTRKPAVISQTEEQDGTIDTVYLGADKLVYYTIKKCDISESVISDAEGRLQSLDVDPVGNFRKQAAAEAAKAEEEARKNDPNYRPDGPGGPGAPAGSRSPSGPVNPNGPGRSGGPGRPGGPVGPGGPGRSGAPVGSGGAKGATAARPGKLSAAPPDALAMRHPADTTTAVGIAMDRTSRMNAPDSLLASPAQAAPSRIAPPRMSPASPAAGRPALMQKADSLSVSDSLMPTDSLHQPDSLMASDSLMVSDSLALADSLAALPKDTTKIGFLEAIGKVKIYKKNMQVVCDSLLYSDLDSLARLFKEPLVWQEITRQYTADSISLVVKNNAMEKASLMSNAFITIQEDDTHYDQIKGTEMLAYFDDKGNLERFDVLGGASALFFLEENGSLATVNKTESKMLSAVFNNGEIQRIYYFEEAKNDGFPVVQLSKEERSLKGYNWQPEKRPADRNAVTPLSLRPSERSKYSARPRARFVHTDRFFPGYMNDVYRQIEVKDSLRRVRERERAIAEREAAERARLDSLAVQDSLALADSLMLADSLALADSLVLADSLALNDSLAVSDTLAARDSARYAAADRPELNEQKMMTPEQIKMMKAAEKQKKKEALEAKRQRRKEAKEARWAELDRRDAEKLKAKEEKRKEKERKRKRKSLEKAAKEAEKDNKTLEKYIRKFQKQKAKEDAKATKKAKSGASRS